MLEKGYGGNLFPDFSENEEETTLPRNVRRKSGGTKGRPSTRTKYASGLARAVNAKSGKGLFGGFWGGFFGSDFQEKTLSGIGKVGRFAWSVMVRIGLYGMLIGASVADIMGGAIALGLIFTNQSQLSGITLTSGIVAIGLSMFTSGVQILLMILWSRGGSKKLTLQEKSAMFGIMIADTIFDITVPFWWAYGETPLTMS